MEHVLDEKVIGQKIGNVNMEDYIADLLEQIEKGGIEKEKVENQYKILKQLNNRHKNIIDAQRVKNKSIESELLALTHRQNQ